MQVMLELAKGTCTNFEITEKTISIGGQDGEFEDCLLMGN